MRDSKKIYNAWLNSELLSNSERKELINIADNENEINVRFGSDIMFGTGGLRSKMMLGTSSMNVHTVARTTQGFANYIKKTNNRPVVIAYDSRNNSKLFARTAASVLAGNGIHVYIFDDIRPTPLLSFALRRLGCVAGINITASHNPAQYNGYKAYWEDGAQLSLNRAAKVTKYIDSVDILNDIRSTDFDKALIGGHITIIDKRIDEEYIDCVMSQSINTDIIKSVADKLSIVFTPLHGAGYKLVPEVLSRSGVSKLYMVEEQSVPDGDFPTIKRPNPEYPEVFKIGIKLADRVSSDLIIATDPDADRVAVMLRNGEGSFISVTGNQLGALLLDYIVRAYETSGTMPEEPYAVKTIVTTELIAKICHRGGVKLFNVLTGFKYIGEIIKQMEERGRGTFLFGAEESCGYLKGTYTRDKDAVLASMLICEMTAHYKLRNMTLFDALNELYRKYGFSLEKTDEIVIDEYNAAQKMSRIMRSLRERCPGNIAGVKIRAASDYLTSSTVNLISGKKAEIKGFPKSDVLRWELENSDVIIIRPSGTEPKIKIYYLLLSTDEQHARLQLEKYISAMAELI